MCFVISVVNFIMSYLCWNTKTITDFSDKNIDVMYDRGFIFTRKGKAKMDQTRSLRIDLSQFELTSENRRVLKKNEFLFLVPYSLPFENYNWKIGKLAKNFYDTKFGEGTFSANKIKELFTDDKKSNFNLLFVYTISSLQITTHVGMKQSTDEDIGRQTLNIGYCISLETDNILHYSYPFYTLSDIDSKQKNPGMAMMLKAILYAKENKKKYMYIGSAQRPTDTYKLQFAGLEWFDENGWQTDLNQLKKILIDETHTS